MSPGQKHAAPFLLETCSLWTAWGGRGFCCFPSVLIYLPRGSGVKCVLKRSPGWFWYILFCIHSNPSPMGINRFKAKYWHGQKRLLVLSKWCVSRQNNLRSLLSGFLNGHPWPDTPKPQIFHFLRCRIGGEYTAGFLVKIKWDIMQMNNCTWRVLNSVTSHPHSISWQWIISFVSNTHLWFHALLHIRELITEWRPMVWQCCLLIWLLGAPW